MKTIEISVRDKIAVNMSDVSYTCGNSDFVINFDFDEEWNAYDVKTARFIKDDRTYQDQVFQGNECPVPVLYNTNKVRVGVFAGNLRTSTPAIITANKGILCGNGSPEAPSDDVYAQIMEQMQGFLKTETDPTVPAWAKEPQKPSYTKNEVGLGNVDNVKQYSANNPPPYPVNSVNGKTGAVKLVAADVGARPATWMPTATEVGALPSGTKIPSKTSELVNDSGFVTKNDIPASGGGVEPLVGSTAEITPTQVYGAMLAGRAVGLTHTDSTFGAMAASSFTYTIATKTVYSTTIFETGGVRIAAVIEGSLNTNEWVFKVFVLAEKEDIPSVPDALPNPNALTINGTKYDGSAAVSVDIPKGDTGETGQRGTGLLSVTTGPSSYTTAVGDITPKYRMAISTIKSQAGVTEVLLGDTVRYSYYHYPIAYLDGSYAYFTTRVSIRGATGAAGSDATVTKASIETALGYTPVGPDDIPTGGDNIPAYVRTEAERVATLVQSRQNENTVTAILSSDYHLPAPGHTYYAQILESITHAGQAMGILRSRLSVDFEAKLGDLIWDSGETQTEALENFQLVHSLVSEGNALERYEANGNHDHLQSNDTPFTDAQVYANIGIYNKGCVKDSANRVGGYCYKDYEEFKLRVILLNTSEANDGSFAVSSAQVAWLKTALAVPTEEGWGTLILSHHPLDWGGSSTAVMTAIKSASGILANLHGHVHTFTQDVITGTSIPRMAIPNVCFYRNNEYGTNGSAENSEGIEFGTGMTYAKVAKSERDTAFCVMTLDRAAGKLYLDVYGAGIDREADVPTWGKKGYTNLVPTSQAADSTEPYNGTGYKNGVYLSSSGGDSADTACVATGYIPYAWTTGNVLYIKGADVTTESHVRIYGYTSKGGTPSSSAMASGQTLDTYFALEKLGDKYYKLTHKGAPNASWLRLSLIGTGENLIVTLNEPIE